MFAVKVRRQPVVEVQRMSLPRSFPDIAICRTRLLCDEIFECVTDKNVSFFCPHKIPFGFGHFCKHPDRRTHTVQESPGRREGQ